MSFEPINFPLTDGINRTKLGTLTAPGTIRQLTNLRHSATQFGRLEQTPYFYLLHTLDRGTYYDAGSQTEPANSHVIMAIPGIYMTQYCFSTGTAQIQAFYQTTQPATTGVTKGCRLVINDVASLAITLGSTVDVEIDGATTFKWRKNGGAWTTGVTITTAGVSIDSGNATLYFLTDSGFTVTDTWSWTRTDRSSNGTVNTWQVADYKFYKGSLYFIARDGRIMIARKDSQNVTHVVSVGYRSVYGQFLHFFFDHLVIGGYGATSSSYLVNPQGKTVGWSDINDVENFIATDVNEADTFVLPAETNRDTLSNTTTNAFITGLFVLNDLLYVRTTFGMYRTAYFGLPIVFSFEGSVNLTAPQSPQFATARSQLGVYLLTADDVVFFDGVNVRSIGEKIVDFIAEFQVNSAVKTKFCQLTYNDSTRELILRTFNNSGFLVYQEKYDTWYYRIFEDSENNGRPTSVGFKNEQSTESDNLLLIGLSSRRVVVEDYNRANQPVFDASYGTVYATPTIIFYPLCWLLLNYKELGQVYIGASTQNMSRGVVTPSSTYYSLAGDIHVVVSWTDVPSGIFDDTLSFTTQADAYWDSDKTNGLVTLPRISFRALVLKLTVEGQVTGKPAAFVSLSQFSVEVRGQPDVEK